MTRVATSMCSSASCRASELMTVASMPIWSAVTRSMVRAAAATPRKILPPPTTMPSCTPARTTSATSVASCRTRSASMPNVAAPAITSPLSFSRMRSYLSTNSGLDLFGNRGLAAGASGRCIAHLEAHEARDHDILTQFRDLGLDQLIDSERVLLDKRLVVQADFLVELAQPPLNDLVDDLLGFAFGQRPGALYVFLFLERRGRHVFLADKLRVGGRDVHGEVVHQALEIVGARHEIRFAVHFHQHTELPAMVNIAADQPLLGGARSLLYCRCNASLAKHDLGFRQVALGLGKRTLALHHAGASALA